MFREMRLKRQQMAPEEAAEVLKKGTSGVLALAGDEGYPYAVPLSYVYDEQEGTIIFHSAKSGHKIDAVRRDGKASFCVVGQDQVVPAVYTTYYRSVTVFGKMRILETDEEKRAAIEKLAVKYAPDDSEENRNEAIRREWKGLCVLEMRVEHMTGKKASELL